MIIRNTVYDFGGGRFSAIPLPFAGHAPKAK
jgi:hypothetical protein